MKSWLGGETPQGGANPKVEPAAAPAVRVEGEEDGLIARGFKLEGTLDVSGPLRIHGTVKGTVRSKSRIVLGEQAQIEGEVHCAHLSVAGKVNGNVHCTERLEILASGLVEGDVHTPSLGIEPGGILEGRCHMRAPAAPGEAARAASSVAATSAARPGGDVKEAPQSPAPRPI